MEQKTKYLFKIDQDILKRSAERFFDRAAALRDFYAEIIEQDYPKITQVIQDESWDELAQLMEGIKSKSEWAQHGFNQDLAVLYGYAQIASEIQRNGETKDR